MTMIRLERVSKRFGAVRAVEEASLEIGRGEFVALLGPSGCGKTTLLRLIAGFEAPDAGVVTIGEAVVAGGAWVPPELRHVGMVFQDYALFPHLSVSRNVGYGLPGRAGRAGRRGARARRARRPRRPLPARALRGSSSGSRSRARSLPSLPSCSWTSRGATSTWCSARRCATSWRPSSVRRGDRPAGDARAGGGVLLADRVALMREGSIVQTGTPEEVYYGPATRWAAEFVGAANVLPGTLADGLVETLVGRFPAPNGDEPGAVQVLVRPELLELAVDPAGEAEVVCREFRGHDVFYRVASGRDDRLLAAALQRVDSARRPRSPAAARRPCRPSTKTARPPIVLAAAAVAVVALVCLPLAYLVVRVVDGGADAWSTLGRGRVSSSSGTPWCSSGSSRERRSSSASHWPGWSRARTCRPGASGRSPPRSCS